jgi:ABC-type bacteriocin/lantibiotic exporter with double-glycine peptidase domain
MTEEVTKKAETTLPQNPQHRLVRLKDLQKLWYLIHLAIKQKLTIIILIVTTALSSLLGLPMPIVLQKLVDAVVVGGEFSAILIWLGVALAVILANSVMGVWMQYVQSSFHLRLNLELRRKVFRSLMDAPLGVLARSGTGDLTTRLTVDVDEATSLSANAIPSLLANIVTLVGFTGVMFYLSPTLAAVSLLLLPIFIVFGLPLIKRIRQKYKDSRSQEAGFNEYITEALRAFNLTKAFSRERSLERRSQRLGRKAAEVRRSADLSMSVSNALYSILATLGPFAVLGFGGYLTSTGEMTPGTLLAFYASLMRVVYPAQYLAQYGIYLGKAMAPVDRILECLTLPAEKHGGKQPEKLLPVELKSVKYRFEEDHPLLEKVDLTIARGEKLGIAGASGAGKSTLLALIAGLLEPQGGTVYLNREDAGEVDLHFRRRRVLLLHQDQPVLGMSVAENLRLGEPKATPEEMWRALEITGVAEIIRKHSDGLDAMLGVEGAVLSGGEKARLCLARAILLRPEAILLDEPFAALDANSADEVWQRMTKELPDTAFVLVSHHPAGLGLVPRIVVLREGAVVEEGNPAHLATVNSEYARLCRSETK